MGFAPSQKHSLWFSLSLPFLAAKPKESIPAVIPALVDSLSFHLLKPPFCKRNLLGTETVFSRLLWVHRYGFLFMQSCHVNLMFGSSSCASLIPQRPNQTIACSLLSYQSFARINPDGFSVSATYIRPIWSVSSLTISKNRHPHFS